MSPLIITASI
jgi:hypothetical protein